MTLSCGKCELEILTDSDFLKCAGICRAAYHITCGGIAEKNFYKLSKETKKKWQCLSCKSVQKKSNSSNVESNLEGGGNMESLKTWFADQLIEFRAEISAQIRGATQELYSSVQFCSDKIDDFTIAISDMKVQLNSIVRHNSEVDSTIGEMKSELAKLNLQFQELDQSLKSTSIEIIGIPFVQSENIVDMVKKIGQSLKVMNPERNIASAHRLKNKKKADSPILVDFKTKDARDEWLAAFKGMKPLDLSNINPEFGKGMVYLNESLTPFYKKLFYETKSTAKAKDYKYTWIRDGKIYVKKTEGGNVVKIRSLLDLDKL